MEGYGSPMVQDPQTYHPIMGAFYGYGTANSPFVDVTVEMRNYYNARNLPYVTFSLFLPLPTHFPSPSSSFEHSLNSIS